MKTTSKIMMTSKMKMTSKITKLYKTLQNVTKRYKTLQIIEIWSPPLPLPPPPFCSYKDCQGSYGSMPELPWRSRHFFFFLNPSLIYLYMHNWCPKKEHAPKQTESAVLLKTALFRQKSFHLIHVPFFRQNSTTNCVFYPMVWLKSAKSLYLIFTKLARKG